MAEVEESQSANPSESMEPFDWDDLERRYHTAMQECEQEERKLQREFKDWVKVDHLLGQTPGTHGLLVKVFETWASVTTVHENDRAYKRYGRSSIAPVMNLPVNIDSKLA